MFWLYHRHPWIMRTILVLWSGEKAGLWGELGLKYWIFSKIFKIFCNILMFGLYHIHPWIMRTILVLWSSEKACLWAELCKIFQKMSILPHFTAFPRGFWPITLLLYASVWYQIIRLTHGNWNIKSFDNISSRFVVTLARSLQPSCSAYLSIYGSQ